MPATYSINVGQIIEAYRKPDIFTVLQDLPDNTQKLISPRDVRDAFLSTWANSSFKVTTPYNLSTSEYIGLDSGNPDDRDIKKKILIGKRSYGNLDVMNSTLLFNNTSDIFFYNTKPDSSDQASTKISFLAGTNSTLHAYAPYIQSYSTASVTDLNIHNPSLFGGAINIASTSGRVAINGIVFPTIAETSASASNGKILRYSGSYPNGVLKWSDSTVTITSIGSPGSPTNIFGDPVLLNGYSLEFIDDSLVPETIGGVTQGSSFPADSFTAGGFTTPGTGQDWPLSEVLRKILYPYIEPVLQLSIINPTTGTTYAEVGTTPSLEIDWSITTYARDDNEIISDFFIDEITPPSIIFYGASFGEPPGSVTASTFIYSTFSNTVGQQEYNLYASTIPGWTTSAYPTITGYSFSATDYFTFLSPFVLSFESSSFAFSGVPAQDGVRDILIGSNLNKLIEPYPGVSQSIYLDNTGSGYLYFMYPYTYGPISQIKDPNGFIIHDINSLTFSAFTYSTGTITPTSPYNYYGGFRVYRTIATCSYTGGGEFEFIF